MAGYPVEEPPGADNAGTAALPHRDDWDGCRPR